MKKAKFLILPLAAAAALLSACGGEQVNQAPELRGVSDINCLVNTYVDLLDGVAALDEEDGDITPNLEITITPQAEVKDGFALFTQTGEYEVCYEIRDSLGKLARTTVTASVIARDVYREEVCSNGFTVQAGGRTVIEKSGLTGSAYAFETSGNEIAEDVILSRSYTMVSGTEYKFTYNITSSVAGRIKVAADGTAIAELNIVSGENAVTFKHATPPKPSAEGEAPTDNVDIALWLGGLEGPLKASVKSVYTERVQSVGGETAKLKDFNFNGSVEGRFDGTEGYVGVAEGGKGAYVEVTKTSNDIWRGGMFISTGLPVSAYENYKISFNLFSESQAPYEVVILNGQWGKALKTLYSPVNGRNQTEITVNENDGGKLWLYVRCGNRGGRIEISGIEVSMKETGLRREKFAVTPFTVNNGDGIASEYGKVTCNIREFGNDWGNNEIASPDMFLEGSADNYIIEFRAKASQRLNCVFAATESGRWQTFAWRQITLTTEEQTFSVQCDNKNLNDVYRFLWQFGNAENAKHQNVTVEISQIKISLKNDLER